MKTFAAMVTTVLVSCAFAASGGTAVAAGPAIPITKPVPSGATRPASGPTSAPTSATASRPASAPTSQYVDPSGGQVMATVNGQPIYMADLDELLLYSYGLPVAQQLVANELVRQEAARKGVTASPQDDRRQHEQAVASMFPTVEPDQRQSTFEQFLTRQSVTRKQWDFTMHRLALLAKLAEPHLQLTDDDLQQAFGDRYGRKVVVRHIQVATLNEAQDVLAQLEKGADFIQLVQKKSMNPTTRTNGGLMMPISASTKGFPGIKDAALALTKVGQLSQVVQVGTTFHVLKLDQIIPPQDVKFADVKDKLQTDLHTERLQQAQQQILMELIRDAQQQGSVDFKNPILRQVWQTSGQNPDQ